jgi:cytochrome c oxidase subunit 4
MTTPTRSSTGADLIIFVTLLALVVVTYEAARYDLGNWNFPVAMAIATTKAILIVWFFMKLRRSVSLTRLTAVAGLLWLTILFGLTASDYWMRGTDSRSETHAAAR